MARGRVVMPEQLPARADRNGRMDPQDLEIDLLSLPFHKSISELEKRLIEKAMRDSAGDKSEAANRLQINRRLLYNKIEEYKFEGGSQLPGSQQKNRESF